MAVSDDQNSLKSHVRGPTLLEDILMREKITHFDHERIPERVVHARGAAAHGFFQVYESQAHLTMAAPLQDPGVETPVFVRFSTVAGSRGSTDTPRDVRGFAVKFYTPDGVWDLVGNNMPVFFIQDANKFPDLIHAVKPEPRQRDPAGAVGPRHLLGLRVADTGKRPHADVADERPRPPAQLRHDGRLRRPHLPAGQRRGRVALREVPLEAAEGRLFAGLGGGELISGKDPDFNRRDLWESIERGDFPE